QIHVSSTQGTAILFTDRRALSQILINLIDNAIKFTNDGSVSVSVQCSASAAPKRVRISVQDTGIGISEQDLGKLFHPFSRLETEAGQRNPGTGLGLHLSKKLAELMGGALTCCSEPGKGTTFTLQVVEP
ncbi:MAG: ATP-binding protein, partial [Polyangiaceae bacterium]